MNQVTHMMMTNETRLKIKNILTLSRKYINIKYYNSSQSDIARNSITTINAQVRKLKLTRKVKSISKILLYFWIISMQNKI